MAADRQRLAQALAAEAARRKMFESIPEAAGQGLPQASERPMGWNEYLENLSIGLGRGAVSNLEGVKSAITSPIETAKGFATGVVEAVRNPRMVAEALKQTGQRAMSGPLGLGEVIGENVNMMRVPGKPVMHELDVYHGTPHRFPATEANPLGEFDASKIGTGEGAQAYGHGIYLAESKNVADQYANMPKFKLGMVENAQELGGKSKSFVDRVEKFGNVEKAKQEAQKLLSEMQKQDIFPAVQEQLANEIDIANKFGKKIRIKPTGIDPQVYKADLPDEMIGRMLDWDKRVSDQPESIKAAWESWQQTKEAQKLKKQLLDRGNTQAEIDKMFANPTGKTVHNWIYEGYGSLAGGENPKVAKFLQNQGVLGVKYEDAGSRGQSGTGTRNFVVFPGEEKKVRILERK